VAQEGPHGVVRSVNSTPVTFPSGGFTMRWWSVSEDAVELLI
jgi:hypothetical protein